MQAAIRLPASASSKRNSRRSIGRTSGIWPAPRSRNGRRIRIADDLVIWKFGLAPEIKMPRGARVLTVQVQKGTPELWALCHAEAPLEDRTFLVFGTGQHFPN